MKVSVPLKMTVLALSISTLAACGGGGGGGGDDDHGLAGKFISRSNADQIARLASTGGSAGKNSSAPKTSNQSKSRNASVVARAAADDDESDGEDDFEDDLEDDQSFEDEKAYYNEMIGQTYKDTSECSKEGTSTMDVTFVEPKAEELYRIEGTFGLDKCRDEGRDYAYTGSMEMVYSETNTETLMELTGAYSQRHTSGAVIHATNYQESATETETRYSTTYSYDATGTPFGDKKVKISTIAPLVITNDDQFPTSGGIRVQADDGSYLTMTVTADGLGIDISVNGDAAEFKSWSQLDSTELSQFGNPEEGSDDDDEDDASNEDDLTDDDATDNDDIDDDTSDDGEGDAEGSDDDSEDSDDDSEFDDDFGDDEEDQ